MLRNLALAATGCLVVGSWATATTVTRITQSTDPLAFNGSVSDSDLIEGQLGDNVEDDLGFQGSENWHPAISGDPSLQGVIFTNGKVDGGLGGLLNDFPGAGLPTKVVDYSLGGATDIGAINIVTGNEGKDGRIFSTFRIQFSTDGGANFSNIQGFTPNGGTNAFGYFESNLPGTLNTDGNPLLPGGKAGSTYYEVGDTSGYLGTGVTDVRIFFYGVDNTGGQYRDPFDGLNPWTNVDDGLNAAIVSPLVWEIDVLEGPVIIPEPATLVFAGLGVGSVLLRRRRA